MLKVGDKVRMNKNSVEWINCQDYAWAEELESKEPLIISGVEYYQDYVNSDEKLKISFVNSRYVALNTWVEKIEEKEILDDKVI